PGGISLPQETLGLRRRGFSPLSRYSCLHSHLMPLHRTFPRRLRCSINAPLPLVLLRTHSFGSVLSPVTLSAQDHSTSELLRTLSRVAASKPTSWLSKQSHIVYHLVQNLGP